MSHPSGCNRLIALSCAFTLLLIAASPARAAMVGTDRVLDEASAAASRAELVELVERDAVRKQLRAYGVSPEKAKARVARMTDAEVAELQGRIEQARAGGGVLGIALVVFVVFVVTDVIGATDIFPFIHPVD